MLAICRLPFASRRRYRPAEQMAQRLVLANLFDGNGASFVQYAIRSIVVTHPRHWGSMPGSRHAFCNRYFGHNTFCTCELQEFRSGRRHPPVPSSQFHADHECCNGISAMRCVCQHSSGDSHCDTHGLFAIPFRSLSAPANNDRCVSCSTCPPLSGTNSGGRELSGVCRRAKNCRGVHNHPVQLGC